MCCNRLSSLCVAMVLTLSACAVSRPDTPQPGVQSPDLFSLAIAVPEQYEAYRLADVATSGAGNIRSLREWLALLGAPALDALIERALTQSHDITAARSNMRKARAMLSAANQTLLPSLALQLQRTDTRQRGQDRATSYQGSVVVGWEIDIWGSRINERNAQAINALSARRQLEHAKQAVIATLTRVWLAAVSARQRLELTSQSLESLEKKKHIVELRYRQGQSAIDAVEILDRDLNRLRTNLNKLKEQMHAQIRAMQVLAGDYPSGRMALPPGLPELRASIKNTLPAELLQNRPDVHAAWLALHAAEATVAARLKQRWLPTFSLSLTGVETASLLRDVLTAPSLWTLGLKLLQNILSPEESLQLDLAREEVVLAAAHYSNVLLRAYDEAESSLLARRLTRSNLDQSRASARSAERLYRFAQQRFDVGIAGAEKLLDQQRLLLNEQIQAINAQEAALLSQLNLLQALGVPQTKPQTSEEPVSDGS